VPKVGRAKRKENPTTKARKLENTKNKKCLKVKNIETGVLEKWSDGVLGLNQYSSTPVLQAL
jgi:hypothetical protein